ncbi:hypothetical protein THTE_1716 [Thermogutta terrifontis]|uniref:Uncharacterized protein n=1 Tax=Thermogutta terrifontis TaxID=1331910 RepID=A0A286RED6_9BACT|nr:hypothetical protein THTE_1716 [Thermogutta terrifontis]
MHPMAGPESSEAVPGPQVLQAIADSGKAGEQTASLHSYPRSRWLPIIHAATRRRRFDDAEKTNFPFL